MAELGQTASNPETGEKLVYTEQGWVSYVRSATNPETGEKIFDFGQGFGQLPQSNLPKTLDERYPELKGLDLSTLGPGEREALRKAGVPVPMEGPRKTGIKQGVSFGFDDELAGLGHATGSAIKGAGSFLMGNGFNQDLGQEYSDARDIYKRQEDQFRTAHPGQALTTNLFGGLVSGGTIAKGVQGAYQAGGLGRATLQGAKSGAIFGGVTGVGTADGGVEERALGGAIGAGAGGVLGAALPTATSLIAKTGRHIINGLRGGVARTKSATAAADKNAYLMLRDALAEDMGGDRAAANAALKKWSVSGADPNDLIDMGGMNTKSLIQAIATERPNQAMTIINEFQENQSSVIRKKLGEAINPNNKTFTTVARQLQRIQREKTTPLYDEAFAVDIPDDVYNQQIVPFLKTKTGQTALNKAMKLADADMDQETVKAIAALKKGRIAKLPMKALDQVKRAVGSMESKALGSNDKTLAGAYRNWRKSFVSILDDANPSYGEARRQAADGFEAEEALELGRKFMSGAKSAADVAEDIAQMTPAQMEFYQIGAANSMSQKIASTGDNANKARFIMNDEMRNKVRALIGNKPEVADDFIKFLQKSADQFETRSFISPKTGSWTHQRQVGAEKFLNKALDYTDAALSPRQAAKLAVKAAGKRSSERTTDVLARAFFEGVPIPQRAVTAATGASGGSISEAAVPGALTYVGEGINGQ